MEIILTIVLAVICTGVCIYYTAYPSKALALVIDFINIFKKFKIFLKSENKREKLYYESILDGYKKDMEQDIPKVASTSSGGHQTLRFPNFNLTFKERTKERLYCITTYLLEENTDPETLSLLVGFLADNPNYAVSGTLATMIRNYVPNFNEKFEYRKQPTFGDYGRITRIKDNE